MTPEELEAERDALTAEIAAAIAAGVPLTVDQKRRITDVAMADLAAAAAEPVPPIMAAVYEIIGEAVALTDRTLPPGLNIRWNEDVLEILSRGEIIATAPGPGLRDRAAEIAAERAAASN